MLSSIFHHRFILIISILLFNPLPLIIGAPTAKTNAQFKLIRQKRQISVNNHDIVNNPNVFPLDGEINFEGLLGCKYDSSVCNIDEDCFDDELFGQCWNGKESSDKPLFLTDGFDKLRKDQLIALDRTRSFLNQNDLDWKDYMTQCILVRIITDEHEINNNALKLFYNDCLNQDELLDEFVTDEGNNIQSRHVKRKVYDDDGDPYISFIKSENMFPEFDNSYDVPIFVKFNEPSYLRMPNERQYFIDDDDIVFKEKPFKFVLDESSMNVPAKMSINIKENHPGLTETLKINSNKEILGILSPETLIRNNITINNQTINTNDTERYFLVESTRGYIIINRDFKDQTEGARLLQIVAEINHWPAAIFTELSVDQNLLTFHVLDNAYRINASSVATSFLNDEKTIESQLDIHVIEAGIGNPNQGTKLSAERQNGSLATIITLATCIWVLLVMGAFAAMYCIKRNERIRNKIYELTRTKTGSTDVYQDLCREHMHSQSINRKLSEARQNQHRTSVHNPTTYERRDSSPRNSVYADEPSNVINMDIMTGHLILSYMEDHLCNRHRLESDWESLCSDKIDEEQASCSVALSEMNENKNRYKDCIPYDHTRVRLKNDDNDDYINASKISDSNPRCKYIATQGPMPNTTNAFWQMVWEQRSCVIVALTRPIENGITMCHHYWPVEGSEQYRDFEVNLVSEHIWSDDYVVRSFYLKNIQTMETRTITQFHFLTWDELCNPPSTKAVLDFRRKVNKCSRGSSGPLIVHCNDGVGRTGTYLLIDIVLNHIYRGAREINIAATLEHIRDQRPKMVKTKEQYEFVFIAVAEEVTDLLKTITQQDEQ